MSNIQTKVNSTKQARKAKEDSIIYGSPQYYMLLGRKREVLYLLNRFCHCELNPKHIVLDFLKKEKSDLEDKIKKIEER